MKTHIRSNTIPRVEELEPRLPLTGCGAATRLKVATAFVGSNEYAAQSIKRDYKLALDRPPSEQETQLWLAWMQRQSAFPTAIRRVALSKNGA